MIEESQANTQFSPQHIQFDQPPPQQYFTPTQDGTHHQIHQNEQQISMQVNEQPGQINQNDQQYQQPVQNSQQRYAQLPPLINPQPQSAFYPNNQYQQNVYDPNQQYYAPPVMNQPPMPYYQPQQQYVQQQPPIYNNQVFPQQQQNYQQPPLQQPVYQQHVPIQPQPQMNGVGSTYGQPQPYLPPLGPDEEYYTSERSVDGYGNKKIKKRKKYRQQVEQDRNRSHVHNHMVYGGTNIVVVPIGDGGSDHSFNSHDNHHRGHNQDADKFTLAGYVGLSVKQCCCGLYLRSEGLCRWVLRFIVQFLTCPCSFLKMCITGFWRWFVKDCWNVCCPKATSECDSGCGKCSEAAEMIGAKIMNAGMRCCDFICCCFEQIKGECLCQTFGFVKTCILGIGDAIFICGRRCMSFICGIKLEDFTGCCKWGYNVMMQCCECMAANFCGGTVQAFKTLRNCGSFLGKCCCCIIEGLLRTMAH